MLIVLMDWSYVVGLFDGEGSVTLSQDKSSVRLHIVISCSYQPTRQALQEFLFKHGIPSSIHTNTNHLGHSSSVWLSNWEGNEKFCDAVSPHLIEKERHIGITKEAIELHKRYKTKGFGAIKAHLSEFDTLRHRLHDLAQKGRHQLKAW